MKIDRNLMFRFFSGTHTRKEADALGRWLDESEQNRTAFKRAFEEYQLTNILVGAEKLHPIEQRHPVFRPVWAFAMAICLLVGLFVGFGVSLNRNTHSEDMLTLTTLPGQQVSLTLTDGSEVQLNSATTLRYPASFGSGQRRVSLEGEAFFKVSKDARHPFVVETFRYPVTVIGTSFDVLADSRTGRFIASLVTGTVLIEDSHSGETLSLSENGRRLVRASQTGELEYIEEGSSEDCTLWTNGIICCDDMSFEEILEVFRKQFGVQIVVERDEMPVNHFSRLRVWKSEGVRKALDLLALRDDFSYEFDSQTGTYIIK